MLILGVAEPEHAVVGKFTIGGTTTLEEGGAVLTAMVTCTQVTVPQTPFAFTK